jgi:membrane protease YdiL (CAAX protease family)
MWFALLLSIVVVAYNNLINRWPPFHGAAYVPVNLAFATLVTVVVSIPTGLSSTQLGFGAEAGDVLFPLVLIAVVAAASFGIARSRHAHRIVDRRVSGMERRELVWYALVRIPLGTAVTEEVIFRGVLFALWRDAGASVLIAALCSSVAFGLWHIMPTVIGLRINDLATSAARVWTAVMGAVLFTTLAGLALTWLRVESEGVLGPVVLHAGINSVGALAAVFASRRTRSTSLGRRGDTGDRSSGSSPLPRRPG